MAPEGRVDVGGVLICQAADQLDGQSPHGGGLVVQGDEEGAKAVGLEGSGVRYEGFRGLGFREGKGYGGVSGRDG